MLHCLSTFSSVSPFLYFPLFLPSSPLPSSSHHQLESSFLSDETTRERLPAVLACVRDKLNSCGFCTISIGNYCGILDVMHVHVHMLSQSPFQSLPPSSLPHASLLLTSSFPPFCLPPPSCHLPPPSCHLPPFLTSFFPPSLPLPDDTNRLHLKITPSLQDPPEVRDYQVPIFTCTREDIVNTSWDLTIEQVHRITVEQFCWKQTCTILNDAYMLSRIFSYVIK